jgi:serine/threonine protein kinase/WD40 repeat protein
MRESNALFVKSFISFDLASRIEGQRLCQRLMNEPGDQEVAIFGAALHMPAEQRAAYLDEACAGDVPLRQRVEAFLAGHVEAGAFLEDPAPGASRFTAAAISGDFKGALHHAAIPSEKAGDRIGRYKLLQQIGEGGCGAVYMAEQEEPVRRMVALKVIKLGMDTKSVVVRFEAERQALALMDHSNIAKVLDAGATDTGRPYFVMELVRGVKITDYCDQNQIQTRERLNLFVQVCRAIQHAHQKGVIHRDIKPSNILVTVNDGVPVPKVIDFGIAKATQGRLTDRTLFTAFEQFMGTPAYMSPEQAAMTSLDIDTRSDIYSLGVLLYELLTGKTPFDTQELMQTGLDEMRRTILEKEPARPSTRLNRMAEPELTRVAKRRQTEAPKLIHTLRGDLDWIVMKALEKDRSRRYETPNGLARDVQLYLTDEPVVARPPGTRYLFQKLVRRNKLAFVAGMAVIASLIIGLSVATVAVFRIKRAKDDATEKLRISYLAEARALRSAGHAGQRFASLETVRKASAIRPDLAARNEAIASLAVSDLRVTKQTIVTGHARNELAFFDPNLERYAIGDANGIITVRTVSNDLPVATLSAPGFILEAVNAFSPNFRYVSARYWHERDGKHAAGESDLVWDMEQQKAVLQVVQQEAGRKELTFDLAGEFSPDSRIFASSRPDGTISIYDLGSGRELKRLPAGRRYNHLILNLGNTLLACSSEEDSQVELHEVESGRKIRAFDCPSAVEALGWSADGRRLATGCNDLNIYVWDVGTGVRLATLEGHAARITSLAFNHAGTLLASDSFDNVLRLWDPGSGRLVANHPGSSWQLQFSPDDRHLLGWHQFGRYGTLEVAFSQECRLLYARHHGGDVSEPEFSADGSILVAGNDDQLRFWDGFSGKEIGSLSLKNSDTQIFHPDGQSMIVVDRSVGVSMLPLERVGESASGSYKLGSLRRLFDMSGLRESALSRDGRHLALTHESEGESFILDLQDPSAKPVVLRPHPFVNRIAISPDGRWVATASWQNSLVKVWDAQSGDLVRNLPAPGRTVVAFSPDGRWLATSSSAYQLWEVAAWQPKGPPKPGHELPEWNFTAFSPDGKMMARTIDGRNIQLLETLTERPLAILEAPVSSGVAKFEFSPDGSHLAAVQRDQQVQLWDLRLIRQELATLHLDWDMPPYPQPSKTAPTGPVTLQVESDASSQTPAQ